MIATVLESNDPRGRRRGARHPPGFPLAPPMTGNASEVGPSNAQPDASWRYGASAGCCVIGWLLKRQLSLPVSTMSQWRVNYHFSPLAPAAEGSPGKEFAKFSI